MRFLLVPVLALVAVGCGDSGSGAGGSGSGECSEDQVSVEYLGEGPEEGRVDCKPIPSECGGTVTCGEDSQECSAALYGLCEYEYLGVACSALEGNAPIISCNY
jgi:hypothetical protein